jgi:two-component system, chemotaxis family, chemotaxis protein CheY
MFSNNEMKFMSREFKKFSDKAEERLKQDELTDMQQKRVETRLILVNSIRRKLHNEKEFREQDTRVTPSVLLIDDMESQLLLHSEFLKELGFETIETAIDGKQGLDKLLQSIEDKNPFGLVLCDWEMPNMTGLELLVACRNHADLWPIPFYLSTGRDSREDQFDALSAGATGYITKPSNFEIFSEKLKRYIFKIDK